MRLSLIYAAMDKSPVIKMPHLEAAIAVWDYAFASAQCIFGDKLGDADADKIYSAILNTPVQSMDRSGIYKLFSGNVPKARIDRALELLLNTNRVNRDEVRPEKGRPKEVFYLPR